MAFENQRILYIASSLLVMTAILYIIANGLPMWFKESADSMTYTTGLWKTCVIQNGKFECDDISLEVNHKVKATRAFMTISCILAPLSIISILSIIFITEDLKKNISILAKFLAVATLISGIIGVSLGINLAVDANNLGASIDISCILAIIGLVSNIVGTITTFFIK